MQTRRFTFIDLFAGIGGIRIPFERVGGRCVFSSEWDRNAQSTYEANFYERPSGDITQIPADIIPDHDILLAGFPCQAFSIMGNQLGFADTRGTLFFEIERILKAKQPPAFMLENVKQLVSHHRGRTFRVIRRRLHELGYHVHWAILNALDFGLPQKRERIFIVGFRDKRDFVFPQPIGVVPKLEDVLEDEAEVPSTFYVSEDIVQKRLNRITQEPFYPSAWHENKSGNVSILPYSCALRAGASHNYLLINGVRRPTPRELLRLQGFPEDFRIVVSHSQVRKQTGNSVAIPVVEAVARQLIKSLFDPSVRNLPFGTKPRYDSDLFGHEVADKGE